MTDSVLPSDCHTPSSNSVSGTSSNASFRITLIGQPNSGKTTLFNILTGSHFKTSNYPGTTVEFLVGRLHERFKCDAQVIDSPGINSLTPQSLDERVSVDSLFLDPNYRHPDLVLVTA
ncbi:MAG TPA: FeoB small GTPase domain-containing protein, partial [bacterium]|nr:FeoB small GTPase domain-containing protein [bacterium]